MIKMADYSDRLRLEAEKINACLSAFPELKISENSPWEKVLEAENYALSAGGKRIRAALCVMFYELFSGCKNIPEYVYEAACAIEMMHTFSLIHDDMPEMDDDELRRGMPATHVKFGTDVGLLAGDGLAIQPYEILSQLAIDGKISADTALRLINVLAQSAGNRGMIAGQMLDLWSENRAESVDGEFLKKMSDFKTGCLLKASCLFGAIMADADGEGIERAGRYAENVGLAFQIVDDVLDVTSTPETLGKPVLSDKGRKKPTFADVLGIDGALCEARRLSALAAGELEKYPRSDLLREFALSLAERKK